MIPDPLTGKTRIPWLFGILLCPFGVVWILLGCVLASVWLVASALVGRWEVKLK